MYKHIAIPSNTGDKKTPMRAGITLTEVVISGLLVGLLLVAALNGVGAVLRTWRSSEQRYDGSALAEHLLGEILQQNYEEPTDSIQFGIESPESPSDRTAWDDVDDYSGWSSAPEDKTNNALTGYSSWTRTATVELVQISDPTQIALADEGLKRVTVTVTDPFGWTTTLVAYRSKWGTLQSQPLSNTTVQSSVAGQITIGSNKAIYSGTNLPNRAEDE